MADWIDPCPKYPRPGFSCLVKCDDGTIRRSRFERRGWMDQHGIYPWSQAHPNVLGWKYEHEAEPEERLAAEKFHDQFLPPEYQRHAHQVQVGGNDG